MNTYMVMTIDREEFESISEMDKAESRGMFLVLAPTFTAAFIRAQEDIMVNEVILSIVFLSKEETETKSKA